MNRRERKRIEKNLGLHKKKLTRQEWFNKVHENMLAGKEKQEQMKETVRLQLGAKKDEVDNNKIASKATELMLSENLSYIEALEKAKELFKEEATEKTE